MAVPIILQFTLLIIMILKFSEYFILFYAASAVLSFAVVLWIINNQKTNPAYKIAWIVPILLLPIFGGIIYLIFGTNKSSRHIKNLIRDLNGKSYQALKQDENIIKELEETDMHAANQARYLKNYSSFPVCKNTKVSYFPNGEKKFEALKEELKKAKHYIFLEYFIIEEGIFWNTILEILEQKVNEGVDVRVIYDDGGSIYTLPYKYTEILKQKGIKAMVFNRFVPFISVIMNNRDHRKIIVIDGHTAFTGGINLADEYINQKIKYGVWKDTAVMLKGDAVWNFTIMFLTMWDSLAHIDEDYELYKPHKNHIEKFQEDGYVLPYSDNPLDYEPVGETVYLNLINKAKNYIYITTPYLICDNEIITALCNAAKSGVDVRIITPHIPDKKMVFEVTRSNYEIFLVSGVKIYEYTPGFMHAKNFVVDDEYAVVGTINLDYRSLYLHFECAAWMYRSAAIRDIKADYFETLGVSQEITLEDTMRISAVRVLIRSVLRLIAPLL